MRPYLRSKTAGIRIVFAGDDPEVDAMPDFCPGCGWRQVWRIQPDMRG